MRMWRVDPKILCTKHLLGLHCETHMFYGAMKKGISLRGYFEKNLCEPYALQEEHDKAAEELKRRGYQHNTPLIIDFSILKKYPDIKIDKEKSFFDLISRCPECKQNAKNY